MSTSHVIARLSWPGSARHLAVVRIGAAAYLISVFASGVIPLLNEVGATLYPGTRSIFPEWFERIAFSTLVPPLLLVGIASSVMMLLGLLTRASVVVTLIAYVVTQNQYYRQLTSHDDWLYLTFYLLVLSFAPCADALSIDALLRRRPPRPPAQYRWPVELMGAWLAVIYGAAGIAKLFPLRKGLVWLNGRSMQGMIVNEIHESPIYWLLGHSLFDYRVRWPFIVLSAAGCTIELAALTTLVWRRASPWVFAAIVGLHIGIGMFGITGFLNIFLISAVAWYEPSWFEPRTRNQHMQAAHNE
jgi:hypothetical protein